MSQAECNHELESDPRFPSGPWVGFFMQRLPPIGKQWMELRLRFRNGVLTGEGRDLIGPFLLSGRYELADGRCDWTKSYLLRHDVHYQGFNEGKGIWGQWEIPPGPAATIALHGGFHIWPEGTGGVSGPALEEEADLPVEEEVAARPLAIPGAKAGSIAGAGPLPQFARPGQLHQGHLQPVPRRQIHDLTRVIGPVPLGRLERGLFRLRELRRKGALDELRHRRLELPRVGRPELAGQARAALAGHGRKLLGKLGPPTL